MKLIRYVLCITLLAGIFVTAQTAALSFASEETNSPLWNVNGWITIQVKDANGNEIVILDSEGKEIPLSEGTYNVTGVWIFENPESYVIYNAQSMEADGYQFALKRKNGRPIDFEMNTYTQEVKTMNTFQFSNLQEGLNTLDLSGIARDQSVMLNEQVVKARKTVTEEITPEDLKVKVEVKDMRHELAEKYDEILANRPPLFSDVRPGSQLDIYLRYLVRKGIISGYPDGTFRPQQVINRAEALKMIFLSRNIPLSRMHQIPFPDVPKSEWYADYIAEGYFLDLIMGYPDGTYRPDQTVNKVEFLKIAMLAQPFYEVESDFQALREQYRDIPPSKEWYLPFVAFAHGKGFLSGRSELHPSAGLTREEAASIIYRLAKYSELQELSSP